MYGSPELALAQRLLRNLDGIRYRPDTPTEVVYIRQYAFRLGKDRKKPTKRNHNPDEIHQEIVDPEVIPFWPAVRDLMDIMVKQTRRVVQCISVQMAHADNYLQWMAQGVLGEYQICHPVAERAPDELTDVSSHPWSTSYIADS